MATFNRLTPKRKFGVELEVITPRSVWSNTYDDLYTATAKILAAAGVKANVSEYGHRTKTHWKITSDGSLSSHGVEIVSPILEGEEGLAEVAKVCEALTKAGYTADRSCGLHVHIDARGFDRPGLFRVVRQFLAEEANFDRMVDERRRNGHQYCASNLRYIGDLKIAHSRVSVSAHNVANTLFRGQRYLKLNLQALWRHHTIEFRQHQGSVSESEVVSWIRLVGLFTDAALLTKNEVYEDMMTKVAPNTLTRPQYIEHFAKLASRRGRRRVMKGDCREEYHPRTIRNRQGQPRPVWNGFSNILPTQRLVFDPPSGFYYIEARQ